jgi:hypothetical protein
MTSDPPHGDPPRDPHDRIEEPPPSPENDVPPPNPDEKERQERGNRGPEEEPGFGQGA